jgi:hypothetical protein
MGQKLIHKGYVKNSVPNERTILKNRVQVIHTNCQFPAEDLPNMEHATEVYDGHGQIGRKPGGGGSKKPKAIILLRLDCLVLKMEAEKSTEASVINDRWKDLSLARF